MASTKRKPRRLGVVSVRTRQRLTERACGCCEICGMWGNNAHHRKPLSQGGEGLLSNLLLLCGSGTTGCHGWVTEHPGEAKANGWSVWRSDEPAKVPVMYRGQWVRLDLEGNVHIIPNGKVRNDLGHLQIETG